MKIRAYLIWKGRSNKYLLVFFHVQLRYKKRDCGDEDEVVEREKEVSEEDSGGENAVERRDAVTRDQYF